MTEGQKKQINKLKSQGYSYGEISELTNISEGTIKSFISRCKSKSEEKPGFCLYCGKPIESIPHHRAKKFCSRGCGLSWWHEHPERLNHKSVYSFTCPSCGKQFTTYGQSKRKYCCHQCYINARFNGGSYAS